MSGSFSQGINSGRSIDPFTNDFIQRTISSNSFGANANFTIFNGFSFKNQIIQNQYNAEADQVEIHRAKNELLTRITLTYMQVLMNQELSKIAQEKLNSAKRQVTAQQIAYDSAKDRYLEGLLHSIELNTFRINFEKAKSSLVQAKYEFYFRKIVLDFYYNK